MVRPNYASTIFQSCKVNIYFSDFQDWSDDDDGGGGYMLSDDVCGVSCVISNSQI